RSVSETPSDCRARMNASQCDSTAVEDRAGDNHVPFRSRQEFECGRVQPELPKLNEAASSSSRLPFRGTSAGGPGAGSVHSCYCGRGHWQRTPAPETMLMSFPEMTCPFTKPGLRLIFRSGASNVPSTIAAQQPAPPPPPENAISAPAPMML